MENNVHEDFLNLLNDKSIIKLIKNESILYSDKIIKINKTEDKQERNFLITDKAIYNLKKTSIQRRIPLSTILGVTISTTSDEFVLHGRETEYDYHYIYSRRKQLVTTLNRAHVYFLGRPIVFVASSNGSLVQYVSSKKQKKNDPYYSGMDHKAVSDVYKYIGMSQINVIQPAPIIANQPVVNTIVTKKVDLFPSITLFSKHKTISTVQFEDFKILNVLREGNYGKICLAKYIPTGEFFSMKTISKASVYEKDKMKHKIIESEILNQIYHPFLSNLVFCFETNERIYFVNSFFPGGELFFHKRHWNTQDENKIKFYGAQIAMALDHLHKNGLIYRDLKPENIMVDRDGYIKITDYGIARRLNENGNLLTLYGDADYLSPELLSFHNSDQSTDWWTLGVILYQLHFGISPFYMENVNQINLMINNNPLRFPNLIYLSPEGTDLLKRLLDKDPQTRLGAKNGIQDIMNHPFFATIDFDKLYRKEIKASFIPIISHDEDLQNYDPRFTNETLETTTVVKTAYKIIN